MARRSAPAAWWFILFVSLSLSLIVSPLSFKQDFASRLGSVFFFPASRAVMFLNNVTTLLQDNRALRAILASQTVDHARLFELEDQNERLKQMLGMKEALPFDLRPGLVIARPGHLGGEYLAIDAGSEAGLAPDQGVISIEGLVGTVVDVAPGNAQIRTLLSPDSRASILVARTGVGGILISERMGWFTIGDIPIEADVARGDTIVTSGLGGIFPPGLKVGTVMKVEDDRRLLVHNVRVRPLVRFSRVREVFAVVGREEATNRSNEGEGRER